MSQTLTTSRLHLHLKQVRETSTWRKTCSIFVRNHHSVCSKYSRDILPKNLNILHKIPEEGFCLVLSLIFLKIGNNPNMQQVPLLSYSFFGKSYKWHVNITALSSSSHSWKQGTDRKSNYVQKNYWIIIAILWVCSSYVFGS